MVPSKKTRLLRAVVGFLYRLRLWLQLPLNCFNGSLKKGPEPGSRLLLSNRAQNSDKFLKYKRYISRSFFFAILCDQKLLISYLSILGMSKDLSNSSTLKDFLKLLNIYICIMYYICIYILCNRPLRI